MPNASSSIDMNGSIAMRRRRFIKNGERKMSTEDGWMKMPSTKAKSIWGSWKGGRYGFTQ